MELITGIGIECSVGSPRLSCLVRYTEKRPEGQRKWWHWLRADVGSNFDCREKWKARVSSGTAEILVFFFLLSLKFPGQHVRMLFHQQSKHSFRFCVFVERRKNNVFQHCWRACSPNSPGTFFFFSPNFTRGRMLIVEGQCFGKDLRKTILKAFFLFNFCSLFKVFKFVCILFFLFALGPLEKKIKMSPLWHALPWAGVEFARACAESRAFRIPYFFSTFSWRALPSLFLPLLLWGWPEYRPGLGPVSNLFPRLLSWGGQRAASVAS